MDSPNKNIPQAPIIWNGHETTCSQILHKDSEKPVRKRRGVILISTMIGKRVLSIRLNHNRSHKFPMTVKQLRVLAMRRKSIFNRNYFLSKGTVTLNLGGGAKCRQVTKRHSSVRVERSGFSREKMSFKLLQGTFMEELEMASANDGRDNSETNIIDELFS